MANNTKKRKILDISEKAIVAITIEAKRKDSKNNFKTYAQQIIEDYAEPLIEKDESK